TLIQTSHLMAPLPEQIRDDDAFHDRWHAYLPGWEVPKLTPDHFTSHLGFIADYIAEIFHNELRPLNYTDVCERLFAFGPNLGHRDRKAVMRTVSGLVKLIHPDGEFRKEELAEYLEFAVEMRRRVKEQLKRINPDEFKTAELSYIDKETGDEFVVHCPELRETPASADWGSAVERKPSSAGHRIEVFHGYELLQALHAGGMAEAFRARKIDSGETVFLKRARTVSSDKSALERETRIYEKLMRTRCKHMLQILDFIRNDAYVALVTEFADGGDLDQFVEERGYGVTPAETKTIGLELAAAIKELHDHEIIHRDLKPGNVLNASGCWKLTDFGISKNLARLITQKTFQQHGTLGYAAPEQFQGCAAHPSADIYSLGKVVVFLLTGQTDVDHIPFPIWRDLVLKCTDPDPDQRPGIDPVIQELGNIRV
ncbi:MAG: protein kinase, partial [Planctomycetes bacterium]|nr:protein kinase [Planctomycetota bacterium]